MGTANRKHLLVEGHDDLYAIVQLMAAHVPWGNTKEERPVVIEQCGGVENILATGFISTKLKSREVETLGIVVDADADFTTRWARLRSLCLGQFPEIPETVAPGGLVIDNAQGKRLGIWIMPDNSSRGMMETFLGFLVPDGEEPVWRKAQAAVREALELGAKCRDAHLDKSNIHTWLAWQDPPGQSFGTALLQKILDPKSSHAGPFVTWFRTLYRL
ncbi:DUF3226 domain-containing protein [Azospirillum thermophilum]|uniref:DUF4435 domain-containing protein n=1 Tax=Azospirillum thermophilum TaxID=2202148 RepID=A0A2S2CKK6_9PROT|nr:DUF3226 domain-containing protein [Azospirillum thermophilum]AWK84900.1 hypothetical protein DEW08_00685 [Azospirillum thermophilum]